MSETDPGELVDRLAREANEMERGAKGLEKRTQEVAQEWERKRADPSVPGAPEPPDDEDEGPPTGAPSGKGDSDSDAEDSDRGDSEDSSDDSEDSDDGDSEGSGRDGSDDGD